VLDQLVADRLLRVRRARTGRWHAVDDIVNNRFIPSSSCVMWGYTSLALL
jgi:hypothetical protein